MKKFLLKPMLLTITVTLGIFTLLGIFVLPASVVFDTNQAGEKMEGVPYVNTPENSGVFIYTGDDRGVFIFLDFENRRINAFTFAENCEKELQNSGYEVNYTIKASTEFIGDMCDRLGGIVMEKGEDKYRFSSVVLIEEIEGNKTLESMEKITVAFFEKISKLGLSSNDFKFIMNNTETNLNYPICYGWIEYVQTMFQNYTIN
ncbi:MAG: hypothetical protein IKK77_02940 [Clostridia bacterium]|nr:hypothetical protein [Clostridia bacterium]